MMLSTQVLPLGFPGPSPAQALHTAEGRFA